MARSTPKPKSTIYVIQSAGSSRAIFDNSNLHHLNCLAISRGLDPIFGYSGMWFRQEKKIEKCSCRSITKSNRKETQQLVRIRKQNATIAAIVEHTSLPSQPLKNRRDFLMKISSKQTMQLRGKKNKKSSVIDRQSSLVQSI